MKNIYALFSICVLLSCNDAPKNDWSYDSESLKIQKINSNLFVHISYLKTDDYGNVPCNGMIYFDNDEAIVFDTPTNNNATKELIEWIEQNNKKEIKAIVTTHFHEDCLGGLSEFHENGIQSYANNSTIVLAKQNEIDVLPKNSFIDSIEIKIGNTPVIAKYFGEGHTSDNVIGYIQKEQALFGGCLIKSLNSSQGYLGDANTSEWSKSVENIKSTYPKLKFVIPGHGTFGGTELLDYTIQLFNNH
nr:subclass B1 metallo-beta-lactamase [uncultured Psychroserpens sp.]